MRFFNMYDLLHTAIIIPLLKKLLPRPSFFFFIPRTFELEEHTSTEIQRNHRAWLEQRARMERQQRDDISRNLPESIADKLLDGAVRSYIALFFNDIVALEGAAFEMSCAVLVESVKQVCGGVEDAVIDSGLEAAFDEMTKAHSIHRNPRQFTHSAPIYKRLVGRQSGASKRPPLKQEDAEPTKFRCETVEEEGVAPPGLTLVSEGIRDASQLDEGELIYFSFSDENLSPSGQSSVNRARFADLEVVYWQTVKYEPQVIDVANAGVCLCLFWCNLCTKKKVEQYEDYKNC